jgi:hypothetical protein
MALAESPGGWRVIRAAELKPILSQAHDEQARSEVEHLWARRAALRKEIALTS